MPRKALSKGAKGVSKGASKGAKGVSKGAKGVSKGASKGAKGVSKGASKGAKGARRRGKKAGKSLVSVVGETGRETQKDLRRLKSMYTSDEFKSFVRSPSARKVAQNPEYVLVTARILYSLQHPEAAALSLVLSNAIGVSAQEIATLASKSEARSLGQDLDQELSSKDAKKVAAILSRVASDPTAVASHSFSFPSSSDDASASSSASASASASSASTSASSSS